MKADVTNSTTSGKQSKLTKEVCSEVKVKPTEKQGSIIISQTIYDLDFSLNILSDYHYFRMESNTEIKPILFKFTPCNSADTLNSQIRLGVHIPKWIENDLQNSNDIIKDSTKIIERHCVKLKQFAKDKNIPVEFMIE